MPRIYVSHRPQDSSHNDIPIILDLLHDKFGAENIFDTNNSTQTTEERQILVKSCDVLLIVVGRFWTSMYDEEGYNMLFDPYDPVNIEINTGFSISMVISTVVVDGVDMPPMNELPDTIHNLHKKRIRLSDDETLEEVISKLMQAWEHIESGTMAKEHGIDLQTMQMEQNEEQLSENPISTSENNNMTYIYNHYFPKVEYYLNRIKQNPRIDLSPQQATEYLANSPSVRIFAKHNHSKLRGIKPSLGLKNVWMMRFLQSIPSWIHTQLIEHRGFWQSMLIIFVIVPLIFIIESLFLIYIWYPFWGM